MAGVINGMNRGPKFPPRARRAGAKLALTDPDQVQIKGNIQIQIITSSHTDTTDLPADPDDGQMVLLYEFASATARLCIAYAGNWHEEVLSQMS
jgi:hypothetical protein